MLIALAACSKEEDKVEPPRQAGTQPVEVTPKQPEKPAPDSAKLLEQAKALFDGPLPAKAENPNNPITDAKVALGRMLYYDTRLSKNHDLSCNSCHSLTDYGIDVREADSRSVSKGHKGQLGDRNSPTVYNAALHFAQFWDGRAADVEEQAKGPVLNPVEMAMADENSVLTTLKSIPGYLEAFKQAFPEDKDPITYDNLGKAIGAFERGLLTPGPFDEFLAGNTGALNPEQLRGLQLFVDVGCIQCHMSTTLGGRMYQKLGLIKPYLPEDTGRHRVTQVEADKYMFKVPSLRNVEKTAPYLHDGSVETLQDMVKLMVEYQTTRGKLSDEEVNDIIAFLKSLTGKIPTDYIAMPELPASGPKTPKPNPS